MKPYVLFALCASALPLTAQAQSAERSGFYGGIQVVAVDLDSNNDDGSNDDLQSEGFGLIAGFDVNRYFAIEGSAAIGGTRTEVGAGDDQFVEVGLESVFGAYGKAQYPFSQNVAVYGRVGFKSIEYEVRDPSSATPSTLTVDDSGAAFGGGIEFSIDKNTIRLDFTEFNGDALPTQSYTLAYIRKF